MQKRYAFIAFALVMAFSLMAGQTSQAATHPAHATIGLSTIVDNYRLSFETPNHAGMVQILLNISKDNGGPVKGLDISGSVEMPQMPMKGFPHEILFTETDMPGIYGALVQYPHGGLWQVSIKFSPEDGKVIEHKFDFTLSH